MSDTTGDLPFQPIRNSLYSSVELLNGYDLEDPLSIARTTDFLSYRYFVVNGRATPRDPYASMMQGLHDNSIARSMYGFLEKLGKPGAAIMGGHREVRGSKTYADVAMISKRLSEAGFVMASGGGPGAMEATHLGALLAGQSDKDLSFAIEMLAKEPELPDSKAIVAPNGTINYDIVAQIHKWAAPAVRLMKQYPKGGVSLAVPTWHYGHEPISPLATHVAKYFLNSIREDVLLALATNGVVFTQGRAGTLQEVFQDAAQNYYAEPQKSFAPMVFFDTTFWRQTLPVEGLLEALFVRNGREEIYRRKVRFTDSIDEVVEFLRSQQPQGHEALTRLAALGLGPVLKEARDANRAVAAPARPVMFAAAEASWGIRRHSAIATAAFARVRSANARAAITQILADAGEASLGSAAAWADNIKDTNPPADPATRRFLNDDRNANHNVWHYVNMPLGVEGYDRERNPTFTREDDVVQMLLQAIDALVHPGASARFEPINALRLVAHLVGDLHQPVHVGCGYIANVATSDAELIFDPVAAEGLLSDRGGNQIKLPQGARNLHSFWDSTLGANSVPAEADYVPFEIANVREVVYGWVGASLVQARKAYQGIRIDSYVANTRGPAADDPGDYNATWEGRDNYEDRCAGIVQERMSAAASNMAALLDAIWPE